ncbi:MAG: hypothetical protein AAF802_10305 [Planctomycetota bacterium]
MQQRKPSARCILVLLFLVLNPAESLQGQSTEAKRNGQTRLGGGIQHPVTAGVTDPRNPAARGQFSSTSGFPTLQTTEESGGEPVGGPSKSPITTTVCALMVVLSLFGVFVWGSRRLGGGNVIAEGIPEDVFRDLGSVPLDAKSRARFLRVGAKIVVVCQGGGGEMTTMTEISDSEEVERITNRCTGRPEIVGRRSAQVSERMAG